MPEMNALLSITRSPDRRGAGTPAGCPKAFAVLRQERLRSETNIVWTSGGGGLANGQHAPLGPVGPSD